MGLRILRLAVQPVVFGQSVKKGPLLGLHGLESQALFLRLASEHAELTLLRLGPLHTGLEKLEGFVRVRDMIIGVGCGVNIESSSESSIALQPQTLFVALERWPFRSRVRGGRQTPDFLLPVLALARDECLGRAGLVLFACRGGVTSVRVDVLAVLLSLQAGLCAVRAADAAVFAIAWSVARLGAFMGAAFERLRTRQTTTGLFEPTGLVFKRLFAAYALLLHQKRAWWAGLVVGMAIMMDTGVATGRVWPGALITTLGRLRSARLWRREFGTTAVATDLFEYSLGACCACTGVADLRTCVLAALEVAAANAEAYLSRIAG